MTKTNRNHLVILGSDSKGLIYLGELDRGVRQGVRRLENAVRFTARGADRVAAGYATGWVEEVGNPLRAMVGCAVSHGGEEGVIESARPDAGMLGIRFADGRLAILKPSELR